MITNLFIRLPSCLSFKGRQYYEGGSRVYDAPMNVAYSVAGPGPGAGVPFMQGMDVVGSADVVTPIVTIRTIFPETWLFDLFETG